MKTRSGLCGLVSVTMVIGVLLSVLLVEGCSTTPSAPATSVLPKQGSTETTKPYGSLAVQSSFYLGAGFDPHLKGTTASFQSLGTAVFDSLVEVNPKGQVRPGIAERWEIAADGMSHTFSIRKGVKFHDGSDLTGADVKFSIERVLSPGSVHSDATTWRAVIDKVELKDDYTVVFRLKSPQFELLVGFPSLSGSPAVVPKKYIEEKGVDYFAKYPVGSGPWKVSNFDLGVRYQLEAVDSHWRAAPKFKNVTLREVKEEAARVAMLKTGELDIAEVSPDSMPGLKAAGLRATSYGGGQFPLYLLYDVANPTQHPMGDKRVRKALSLAINRREMGDKILGGYAEPLAVYHVSPTSDFFDAAVLKPDPFDPEQAKKLLVEAGYPNGFSMKLWSTGEGNDPVLNSAVAGYYRNIGVNAEVVTRDNATIQGLFNPKVIPEAYNSAVGKMSASMAFGFEKVPLVYHSKKGAIHNINNPRLDELIDKVPRTLDPVEKKRLALEAAVLAREEYTVVGVLSTQTVLAIGSKVDGLTPVPGIAGLAYFLETITHAK